MRIITGGLKDIIISHPIDIPRKCNYCGNIHDFKNRLPESHSCNGLLQVFLSNGTCRKQVSNYKITDIVVLEQNYFIEYQRR